MLSSSEYINSGEARLIAFEIKLAVGVECYETECVSVVTDAFACKCPAEITTEEIEKAQSLSDNVWLSPNFEKNDKDSIQLALDAGIGVSFWTVNTLEDAKMLYDMGVRYIESDILCK